MCGLGVLTVGRDGWAPADDGAGAVPVVALFAVALARLRWRPEQQANPVRPVSAGLAHGVNTTAAALAVLLVTRPDLADGLFGPAMTLALFGTYLALWGYRALALLRTVTLLSILTWAPAANFAHSVVRSTLEQPSSVLYRRLAQVPMLDIADEPWRLFSAELHRGSLVVIATLALAIGANRWRVSARTGIDLALTVAAALVVHHLVILSAAIDQYQPSDVTQVATDPTLEIAISAIAVALLSVVRARRARREQQLEGPPEESSAPSELAYRDPVIFANTQTRVSPLVTGLFLTSIVPLVVLAFAG